MAEQKFKDMFKSAENVTLKHMKLNEANAGAVWRNLKLTKIISLDVSHNEFKTLHIDEGFKTLCLFEGFRNLVVLNLSNNPIDHVHPNAFCGLSSLVHLNMSNTGISKDHHFRCVRNLPSVKNLDLSNHLVYDMSLTRFAKTVGTPLNKLEHLDIRPLNCPKMQAISANDAKIIEKYYPCLKTYNGLIITKPKIHKRNTSTETVKHRTVVNQSTFFRNINNKLDLKMREMVVSTPIKKDNKFDNVSDKENISTDRIVFNDRNSACISPRKEKQENACTPNKSIDFSDMSAHDQKNICTLREFFNKKIAVYKAGSLFTFRKCDQPDESKVILPSMIDKKLNFN